MGLRRLLPFVCVLLFLLVVVPAAAADQLVVTSIAPGHGAPGTTVVCTVRGEFFYPTDPFLYEFEPEVGLVSSGGYTLMGTTLEFDEWSGQYIQVSFAIPAAAPAGLYDVEVTQKWDFYDYTARLYDAFTVATAAPSISGIDPASVAAGSQAFSLQVTGANFVTGASGAVVRWNSTDLVTTRDSSTRLRAAVPASLVVNPGTVAITVRNGSGLGAPVSNAVTFTVGSAVPTVSSLSPASVWAGCVKTDVVLTVSGSGFVSGSRIVINGSARTTTSFVSATQLTVPLLAADMALPAASIAVSVANPPFPPGTQSLGSRPLTLQPETTVPIVYVAGADDAWHNTPVTLTFTASDAQSGVQKVQYTSPPGVPSWTSGTSYTVPTSTQGAVAVDVQALDWCNKVGTARATVNIDATQPETQVLGDASVRKGKTARLRYRIGEPAGLSPSADVVIKIRRGNGSTARTIEADGVPVNSDQTAAFPCNLAKGKYGWSVYATDLAGNTQENIAKGRLTVK